MNLILPARCAIPDSKITGAIKWLEIHSADNGYYLFHLIEIGHPPKFDNYYELLEELLEDCFQSWGIKTDMWARV